MLRLQNLTSVVSNDPNALLQKILHHGTLYNNLTLLKGTGAPSIRLRHLEHVMIGTVSYLTDEPLEWNDLRWSVLTDLLRDVIAEFPSVGVKALDTPADFKTVGPVDAYMLERVDVGHRQAQLLSDEYQKWLKEAQNTLRIRSATERPMIASADAVVTLPPQKPPVSLWAMLPAGLQAVAYEMREEERNKWRIQFRTGFWRNNRNKPASTLGMEVLGEIENETDYVLFVASARGEIFIHNGSDVDFFHSSFLAGASVLAAGTILIRDGKIRVITPNSGHYKPDPVNMMRFVSVVSDIQGDAAIQPKKESDRKKKKYYRVRDYRQRGDAATPLTLEEVERIASSWVTA